MYLKDDSLYISGLMHMASFNMGPSYADAFCLSKDDFVDSFARVYGFSTQIVKLKECDLSIESLFKEVLNLKEKAYDTLVHWTTRRTGKYTKTYTAENKELFEVLSGEYGGCGPFFFLEDVYFIEFEKMVICIMIGNDE